MSLIDEKLSEQFYKFEQRGRGWQLWPYPVSPEPPFRPFDGYYIAPQLPIDDGRRPTTLSSFVQRLTRASKPELPPPEPVQEEPEPTPLTRDSLVELQVSLPDKLDISKEAFEQFLLNLSLCREPLAFELLGVHKRVTAQFATGSDDASLLRRQLQAHFPEAVFVPRENALEQAWEKSTGDEVLAVEFGLAREFMLPLAGGKLDPFIGIIGALSDLQPDELGLFQVLFQPALSPWPESILRSVIDTDGNPFFVNQPELASAAEKKIARPLFAVVVRILLCAGERERLLRVARDLAGSLRVFAHPNGNELIPLHNDDYGFEDHIKDVLRRQTRRTGMLLNSEELIGFVHLPASTIRSPVFQRQTNKTKAAPAIICRDNGLWMGNNNHAGEMVEVRLSPEQRTRHAHLIGASGTGKSTLLFNLIQQDIEAGEGIAVFDPHGDLIDRILGSIPKERIGDVILVDPSDESASIGFNILSAHSDLERTLLASDLVAVFHRLSTSWGDQMGGVLRNAILAFLESSQGGTLSDLRRFLLDSKFRERFLATVQDPDIRFYWQKGFTQLSGGKSIGPVLTRLEEFLSPKPLRYMVAQPGNRLDFTHILDSGKIFLAKLSQGAIGKENAYLLGSLLMAKFQQTAMARQRQAVATRRDFFIYLDEFQNFITPSLAELLSGARKYRVGLVLAHQDLRQLERDRETAGAVLSNCGTRIVFRVSDEDARKLESGFTSFTAGDLQNLGTGEAVARVERSDYDFNLTVPAPEEFNPEVAAKRREEVTLRSRVTYATPRAEIESALRAQFELDEPKGSVAPKAPIEVAVPRRPIALKPGPPHLSPAEVPKVTVPPAPEHKALVAPLVPADLGRGGAQHQEIQRRLKESAQKFGYLVTVEKPVLDRTGSVDLALEKSNRTIAVEITVTTTIDHEVGNVLKCLRADFHAVAVVSSSEVKLQQMKEAVTGAVGAELAVRVGYFTPDHFIDHLERLAKDETSALPPKPTETTRRGYKVKRSAPKLTLEELRAKEQAGIRTIAEVMKRKGD